MVRAFPPGSRSFFTDPEVEELLAQRRRNRETLAEEQRRRDQEEMQRRIAEAQARAERIRQVALQRAAAKKRKEAREKAEAEKRAAEALTRQQNQYVDSTWPKRPPRLKPKQTAKQRSNAAATRLPAPWNATWRPRHRRSPPSPPLSRHHPQLLLRPQRPPSPKQRIQNRPNR